LIERSTSAASTASATICATWWRTSFVDHWCDRRSSFALAVDAMVMAAQSAIAEVKRDSMVVLPLSTALFAVDVVATVIRKTGKSTISGIPAQDTGANLSFNVSDDGDNEGRNA